MPDQVIRAEFYAEGEEKPLRTLRFRNPTSEEVIARLDAALASDK